MKFFSQILYSINKNGGKSGSSVVCMKHNKINNMSKRCVSHTHNCKSSFAPLCTYVILNEEQEDWIC